MREKINSAIDALIEALEATDMNLSVWRVEESSDRFNSGLQIGFGWKYPDPEKAFTARVYDRSREIASSIAREFGLQLNGGGTRCRNLT